MEIKALVADSSTKARKNIIRGLKEIGVRTVAEASNGDEAMQLLEMGSYDVVFAECDTQINGGQKLVAALRKVNAKLPIIVTARPSKKSADLQKSCPNASYYLTLPVTPEQLRKTVSQYVPSIAG
jgi:two-component system, chemotaxis family, chemotaxis protein CheY